jgi:hypothetical protein
VARGACLFLAKGQCVANGLPGKPAAPPPGRQLRRRTPVRAPSCLWPEAREGGGYLFSTMAAQKWRPLAPLLAVLLTRFEATTSGCGDNITGAVRLRTEAQLLASSYMRAVPSDQ